MAENSKKSIFALDDEEDVKQIDPSLSDSGIVTLETSPSVLVQSSQNDPEDDDDIQLVDEPFADGQDDTTGMSSSKGLTAFQKAKVERNRQRALLLRQARLQAHPYKKYYFCTYST